MERISSTIYFSLIIILMVGTIGFVVLLLGCNEAATSQEVSLLSWNVQNLFDGVDNGGEYPEFDPSSGKWNEGLFHDRLELLSKALLQFCPERGPDLLVLLEIENRNVMETLNKNYLSRCGYRYRYCSQNDEGIQFCLLSRLPIQNFRSHRLSLQPEGSHPHLRDILSAEIEGPKGNFLLFINHWKSRLGGAAETEKYRLAAATLLNRLFSERGSLPAVACGDFNCSWDEYARREGAYLTSILPVSAREESLSYEDIGLRPMALLLSEQFPPKNNSEFDKSSSASTDLTPHPVLYSPWLLCPQKGSYFYRENWETLDHFFLTKEFFDGQPPEFKSFKVIEADFLKTKEGHPKKWITELRDGYSDHLPILIRFS